MRFTGESRLCLCWQVPQFNCPTYEGLFTDICGPGSSVGIATELRAGRSGIQSRWGRDFLPVQTHPASCTVGTVSFLGVKCGRGVLLTTHPLLVPRSYLYTPSGPHRACNGIALPLFTYICLVPDVSKQRGRLIYKERFYFVSVY